MVAINSIKVGDIVKYKNYSNKYKVLDISTYNTDNLYVKLKDEDYNYECILPVDVNISRI